MADAMATCIDWMTGSRIVAGLSNGHVVAWDVVDALKSPSDPPPLPALYIPVAQSSVRSIAMGRVPPGDEEGTPQFTGDPIYLVCGSYDASAVLVDLRDPLYPLDLSQTRVPVYAVGWASQMSSPMYSDSDHVLVMHKFRGMTGVKSHHLSLHRGPIWDITTSDYHTMAVTAGSDGAVLLCNFQAGWFRRRGTGLLYQRLFEMDYDLHTGEYRMTDDFLPEEMTLDAAAHKNMRKNKKKGSVTHSLEGNPATVKTGNWAPQVGVHRVCWNNGGLGRAGWVVSGTASGLGRVDVIRGRFDKGVVPDLDSEHA